MNTGGVYIGCLALFDDLPLKPAREVGTPDELRCLPPLLLSETVFGPIRVLHLESINLI